MSPESLSLPRLLVLLLALGLTTSLNSSCASSQADDDDTSDDDDDTSDDDDDATPAPQGSLSGRVVDLGGAALADIGVSCCSDETCLTATTAADGSFLIEGLNANTYVVDNLGYPGNDAQAAAAEWGKFFDFVTIGPDEAVILERDLVLPLAAEPQQVVAGANSLSYAGGLEVNFDGSAISLPFIVGYFTDDDDDDGIANYLDADASSPLSVSSIELEADAWPAGGLDGNEVKMAWAFAPFETALESGSFTVSMTLTEAVPSGMPVTLMWADYEVGVQSESFESTTATISSDGLTLTGEVSKLSVLMMVAPGH